jgi:bifunctional DNA-binding transcriptional regulator/antitoxin component of YhaV-PrlF toxin-antitoxin module
MTTTVTDGNNVTIPGDIAADLGIKPGTHLEWRRSDRSRDTIVVKVVPVDRTALAKSLFGAGKKFAKPGDDPIGDLVRERALEDAEREASL